MRRGTATLLCCDRNRLCTSRGKKYFHWFMSNS